MSKLLQRKPVVPVNRRPGPVSVCLPEAPGGGPPTAAVTATPSVIPAIAAACAAAAIISQLHSDPGRHR